MVRRRCRVGIAIAPPFLCFGSDVAVGFCDAARLVSRRGTPRRYKRRRARQERSRALGGGQATLGLPLPHRPAKNVVARLADG